MVTLILFVGFVLGFLVILQIGARWTLLRDRREDFKGPATIENAVFALVAFFIAFSFASAQGRLERRTQLLIDEANALSTSYARVDLCDPQDQMAIRMRYGEYVRLRTEGTQFLPDISAAKVPWGQAEKVGADIWRQSVSSTPMGSHERILVVEAINEMLDAATRRSRTAEVHVPWLILGSLIALSALAALLAGRSIGATSRYPDLHQWILACTFALTLTILVDLDHPRLGFIRIESGDAALTGVQQMIDNDLTRG